MVIHLPTELEAVPSDRARRRGVSVEDMALGALPDRFLGSVTSVEPRDG
jgi:hypothetical protein